MQPRSRRSAAQAATAGLAAAATVLAPLGANPAGAADQGNWSGNRCDGREAACMLRMAGSVVDGTGSTLMDSDFSNGSAPDDSYPYLGTINNEVDYVQNFYYGTEVQAFRLTNYSNGGFNPTSCAPTRSSWGPYVRGTAAGLTSWKHCA